MSYGGRFNKTLVGLDVACCICQVVERRHGAAETDADELLDEVTSLSGLHHENVVRLLGVCCTARPLLIVTEHDHFSSTLKDKLRTTSLVSRARLVDLAVQVTLTTCKTPFKLRTYYTLSKRNLRATYALHKLLHRPVRTNAVEFDLKIGANFHL